MTLVSGPAMPSASEDAAFPEGRVTSGDRAVTYRQCGQGTLTVLLLHGISSGAASWAGCAMALKSHARVVAWNAPGYSGSSPLAQARPCAMDYARQIDFLLDGLGIQSCVLVGHSLGALMAAAYNQLSAARIQSLVLLSPAVGYGEASRAQHGQTVRADRLAALAEKGIEGVAAALPQRLLTSRATARQRDIVRANALLLNEAGYRQAVELLCADDIHRYAVDAGRTRVYCGEHDVVTQPAQCAAYAERHGLPFDLIADAGHACYVEQPQKVAEFIVRALPRETSDALCK